MIIFIKNNNLKKKFGKDKHSKNLSLKIPLNNYNKNQRKLKSQSLKNKELMIKLTPIKKFSIPLIVIDLNK